MCKASLNHRRKGSLAFLWCSMLWKSFALAVRRNGRAALKSNDYVIMPLWWENNIGSKFSTPIYRLKKTTLMEFVVYIIMNILKFSMCFIGYKVYLLIPQLCWPIFTSLPRVFSRRTHRRYSNALAGSLVVVRSFDRPMVLGGAIWGGKYDDVLVPSNIAN